MAKELFYGPELLNEIIKIEAQTKLSIQEFVWKNETTYSMTLVSIRGVSEITPVIWVSPDLFELFDDCKAFTIQRNRAEINYRGNAHDDSYKFIKDCIKYFNESNKYYELKLVSFSEFHNSVLLEMADVDG